MNSDDEDSLGSDTDYADDMEALKRACVLAGTDLSNLQIVPYSGASSPQGDTDNDDKVEEDDCQFLWSIKKRFDLLNEIEEEQLSYKPTHSLLPVSLEEDREDDFETLRAIQHRFAAYDDDRTNESFEKARCKPEQVGVTNIHSEKETSSNCFLESSNAWEGFPNCVDKSSSSTQCLEACNMTVAGSSPSEFIGWHKSDADDATIEPVKGSNFPKSAQAFIDAIKKNRSCQQLIRSKLMHIEARIEEIKLLKGRVKILKDFQISCKTRTGKALSQKKDARVRLISAMKPTQSKGNGKLSAMHYGPAENSQVATYRDAQQKFPVFLSREKWSDKEKENLAKGVRQQFQQMMLQRSTYQVMSADGSPKEHLKIYSSISGHDITPKDIRAFLPNVNWDQLASMYVLSRSGAECQARWLNCEDSLINHSPWSAEEDKNLLRVVQHKGLSNWIDIAVSLGTNRTPFQCLSRYQRSLNASIIKRNWTKEEDNQLRAAVEAFGESNWQTVASSMEGRTGTQCSNRWIKTLHPARQKVGTWTSEEDERLKVAVMLFGPKTWRKVADSIPGRTHVQCRERWVNNLDPSLNLNTWTEEEDQRLEEAIQEHGYSWSKVATCVSARTDNQCLRRWKILFPQEVHLLRATRSLERAALGSNFVDREADRSSLAPSDFALPTEMTCISQSDDRSIEKAPRLTYGAEVGNFTGRNKRKGVLRKMQDTMNSVRISNDKGLKTSGGRLVTEDANCNRIRASKLQPRRRKCLSKQDNGNVENGECSSSFGEPGGQPVTKDANCNRRASKLQSRRRKCLAKKDKGNVDNGECSSSFGESGGRPVTEDANCNRRASKLQPRRRKCSAKKDKGNVGNGECNSSFGEPSLLMDTDGWDANDGFRIGEAGNVFWEPHEVLEMPLSNQVETNVASEIARKESKPVIVYTRRGRIVMQNNSLSRKSATPDVEDKELYVDETERRKFKSNISHPRSERVPPASSVELKLAKERNAKPSRKRHRNCLSPIRSSPSDILENGNPKKRRSLQARELLNRMMEEDDTSLASLIHHIKFLKRKQAVGKAKQS